MAARRASDPAAPRRWPGVQNSPVRTFRERSRLASAVRRHQDRRLTGRRLNDAIAFEPRVRALGGLQAFALEAAFRWRHRRLRRRFGTA